MRVYVDTNVIYYHLTDNPEFADRATELLEEYYGMMITSALTFSFEGIAVRDQS